MQENLEKNTNIEPENLRFAVLAVDIVLWTIRDEELFVRLIPVHLPPHFLNKVGLPGGLINPDETAEQSANRLLAFKAKVAAEKVYMEQLYTFSEVGRDPRGRVVAVAYSGIVPWDRLTTSEQENTDAAKWVNISKLSDLAYDHQHIIDVALERLQSRIVYTTLIEKFMPKEFTLTELETAYKLILQKDIDKRNFRKKILSLDILEPLSRERRGQKSRPAKLYSFRSNVVQSINVL